MIAGLCQVLVTGRRESDAAFTPVQKRHAEFVFQVSNLSTERRLGQMQARRSAREIPFFGYGHEVAHVAQFHSRTIA
jgi:hypothetical protein